MKRYCDNCQKEVKVIEEKLKKVFNVKGEKIEAEITIYKCPDCGEEVWDEELEKRNERIVFSLYRQKMNMLQPSEIKAIRDKWGLSQALFAKLMGCGEKTITRYENGSIQELVYDNMIRLMNEEKNYEEILELRRESLTNKEYESAQKALCKNKEKTKDKYAWIYQGEDCDYLNGGRYSTIGLK